MMTALSVTATFLSLFLEKRGNDSMRAKKGKYREETR